MTRLTSARFKLHQIGSAYRESRVLYLAVKLNLADLIAKKNIDVDDLARVLNINAENLYILLRALVSFGVFNEVSPKVFSNNKMSRLLKSSSTSGLNHTILAYHNKRNNNLWFEKLDLVFNTNDTLVLGNYLAHETLVQDASSTLNPFDGFNWSSFDLMFDSGNADGQHVMDILSLSECMSICIYDNPKAIKSAKNFCKNKKSNNVSGSTTSDNSIMLRVSFEEGEILRSLPKASTNENLYCFTHVFSRLNDNNCLSILSNAKKAIGQFTATLVIIDSIQSETLPSKYEAMNDMQLLLEKNTKQRTLIQWQNLVDKSNFTITEVVELRSLNKVLVLKSL